MKQEEIDKLMNEIDKKCKLPKHWDKFIEKNSKKNHLIIKYVDEQRLYCTNCDKYFKDENAKVGNCIECPHCHKKLVVYGKNYYKKEFIQPVVLVQRINKQVVIRLFEIYSYFKVGNPQIQKHYIEYVRILPGIGKFIGNNVYMNRYGLFKVYHGYEKIYWYKYKGYRFFTNYPTYPYNKKKLIKGTNMEYSPINEFLDKFSYYKYNFLDVLNLAAYESFELLWNMKLYNLCFYSKALNKNGNFYKRFGVPKSFLKYMQDKNISYKELLLLRVFQKNDDEIIQKYYYENINFLNFFKKHDIMDIYFKIPYKDRETIKVLNEISKYIPLKKIKNYQEGLENLYIYRDYLEMAKKLALNYKSKKDLFPKNLIARHDQLQKRVKITEDRQTQFGVYLRYLELSKYTYEDEKYMIFPAPSVNAFKEEGENQDNCVATRYMKPYIDGETEIYFIRKLQDLEKSFITLEYKDNRVVQKELPHHSKDFKEEHIQFIDKWCQYRAFMDKKQRYEKTVKAEKIVKYKLNQEVA